MVGLHVDYVEAFEAIPLGDLITKHTFKVPLYQRPYSWENDQLEEFWEDLLICSENTDKGHFIGPMFLMGSREENLSERRVLDGQQRLITTTIILRLMYDFLSELSDNTGRYNNNDIFGKIRNHLECRDKKRIKCNERNQSIYEFLMRDDPPFYKLERLAGQVKGDKTNKKIVDAYKFFLNKMLYLSELNTDKVKIKKDKEIFLEELKQKDFFEKSTKIFKTLTEGFYLLEISLCNEDLASEIFETLNQRGEKLMFTDLFKNMLFDKFKAFISEEEIMGFWEVLLDLSDNDENKIKEFLRYYWLSAQSFIREKELFKAYRGFLKGIGATKEDFNISLKERLINEAKIFFALSNPASDLWPKQDKVLNQLIKELNYLGFKQQMPFLLSVYICSKGDRRVLKETLKVIINFLVKRQIFLQRNPNEYEDKYSKWAIEIRNSNETIGKVLTDIRQSTPKKSEIVKILNNGLEIKKTKYAKYILMKVNDSLSSSSSLSIWNNDPTLEHICPRTPNEDWEKELETKNIKHLNIINRLGNYTLLGSEENSELGNISFEKKKKRYSELKIPINERTIKENDQFSDQFINEREKRIAKIIEEKNIWENI
jgi:uncharacterized protein with ParB-like and HNH nuclease domain